MVIAFPYSAQNLPSAGEHMRFFLDVTKMQKSQYMEESVSFHCVPVKVVKTSMVWASG
jgi:hypothetical protein